MNGFDDIWLLDTLGDPVLFIGTILVVALLMWYDKRKRDAGEPLHDAWSEQEWDEWRERQDRQNRGEPY